jgi:CRP/FNR family cyclic AMP-dependent transcriptional regulator
MHDLKTAIGEHPFLRRLSSEHLDILAAHVKEVTFKPGEVILRESRTAYEFYLILAGTLSIESHVGCRADIPLQVVRGGEVLGWSWLFPPFATHFQATALETTKAIFLDGASLLVASEKNHELGYELMKRIAQVIIHRLQAIKMHLLDLHRTYGFLPVEYNGWGNGTIRTTSKPIEASLAECPFLSGMKPGYIKIIAASTIRTEFGTGELILREGDPATRFFVLESGKAALEVLTSETGPVAIEGLHPGDVLGWSWLFPPYYWHFDARALEPTAALSLYGTRLREQCEENKEFGYELMKRVCHALIHRVEATRGRVLEVTKTHAENRAASHPDLVMKENRHECAIS